MLLAACGGRDAYVCSASEQCVGGAEGRCEASGYCSFADETCPDGRRYEPNAGGGLAGTCVESAPPDSSTCTGAACATCVRDIAYGAHFGCLVRMDGTVWCAGENDNGELGFGLSGMPQASWMQVRDSTGAAVTDATAIAAGRDYACAIRAGGNVWCWGYNGSGQLGIGRSGSEAVATQVVDVDDEPLAGVTAIRGGQDHACALDAEGIWCWGENDDGELGDGTNVARDAAARVLVAAGGNAFGAAVELSIGEDHSCVRDAANAIWCWGANSNGQLGDGSETARNTPVMVTTAAGVAAGLSPHTCVLRDDGTAACMGSTWRGRLGNGSRNDQADVTMPVPVVTRVGGPALGNIEKVVAGGVSCALIADGGVQCWGDSTHGQTGAGYGSPVPVAVIADRGAPLTEVEELVAGYGHVCARRATGEYWCWGRGISGEHGDGTFSNRGVATPLSFACP